MAALVQCFYLRGTFVQICPAERQEGTRVPNRSICCRRKTSFLGAHPECSKSGDWQRGSVARTSQCCWRGAEGQARKSWRDGFTLILPGATVNSSRSIVRQFPERCSRASCLVTKRERLQEPMHPSREGLSLRIMGPCFWTRLRTLG